MTRYYAIVIVWAILAFGAQAPASAQAQDPPVIAYLSTHLAWVNRYREALAEVGYVDGRNIRFVWRGTDHAFDRLPEFAQELLNLRPRLILTDSSLATRAAKSATSSVPIVFSHVADPVRFGFVASFARPGGNVTGVTIMTFDLTAKRLEVLREAVPHLTSVALLTNPTNPLAKVQIEEARAAASQAGLRIQTLSAVDIPEVDKSFAKIPNARQVGVLVTDDNLFWNRLGEIAKLSVKYGLPTIAGLRLFPEAGGLMSYGASPKEQYQRVAAFADKILKGADPGELPVERATKLELVVNLSTARALGIPVSQPLLLRADEAVHWLCPGTWCTKQGRGRRVAEPSAKR